MSRRSFFPLLVLALVLWAYSNHFGNSFHFDDAHTVVDNPAIRTLAHWPTFFQDGRTFSINPSNQGWRPLVTLSLAIDYALGGGLKPFWFHLDTFALFLLQLGCMAVLFGELLRRAGASPGRCFTGAWVGVGVYALHPAGAETINYVIQRADLHVALGLVAGLALYARLPRWRKSGCFLLPWALAALAKPTALVFPLLLLAYQLCFERGRRGLPALMASLTLAVALAGLHRHFTPATYTYGGSSPSAYRLTQPWVSCVLLRQFLWPDALSADTDMQPVSGWSDARTLAGFLGLAALLALTVAAARRPTRDAPTAGCASSAPLAFGLCWFLITQLPTALAPLAEVTNDHRMFGPFVGLALCVGWGWCQLPRPGKAAWLLLALLLGAEVVGTRQRNRVWRDEESLWADVVQKSPRNGRGWMNYGLTQMAVGRYPQALAAFEKARPLTPNYSNLEINFGVVLGALGRKAEAEAHFQRALGLDAGSSPHYFYAIWLIGEGRGREAESQLRAADQANSLDARAADRLAQLLLDERRWNDLRAWAAADPRRADWIHRAELAQAAEEQQRREATRRPGAGAGAWVELSFFFYRCGRFEDACTAARQAAQVDPRSALAFNNQAAALLELKRYPEAIAAAQRAVALKPDFALARNNLAAARRASGHL